MTKVSIIIPTYQRCNSVKRTLTALCFQTFPHEDYEVIVSIDGSEDGTREMLDQFSSPYKLCYTWEPNSGKASACNRAIREASGDILIFLDDDMEPSTELVEAHYSKHQVGTKLAVIGAAPIVIDKYSTPAARFIAAEFNSRPKKITDPDYNFKIWDFYGGNFSIRHEHIMEVGAFNESFQIYGYEDIELAHRLTKAGIQIVYDPDAICTQHYEEDFKSLAKKTIKAGKTAVLMVNMHPETFEELKFREYNLTGWKWRSLRLFLIRTGLLIPITTDFIIFLIQLFEKANPDFQEKVYSLAYDYFFWFGVWSAIKVDEKNEHLISKIRSYNILK